MNFDDFMMKTLSAMTPIILICQLGSRVKLLKGWTHGNVKFVESRLRMLKR